MLVAAGGVLTVAAETGLRVWAHHHRVVFEEYDAAADTYRLVPGTYETDEGDVVRINDDGLRGPALADRDAIDLRVVAVGDSCTFGSGGEMGPYPARLQQLLAPERTPGRRIEVVNAGVAGALTRDVVRRFDTVVAPLQPDVVLVYVGWNDLMKRSPLTQRGGSLAARASAWLDDLWLVRGARKALYHHARRLGRGPATGEASRSGRFESFVPGAFEARLDELLAAIRDAGAQPVVLTLATPLRLQMSPALVEDRGIFYPFFFGADRSGDLLDLVGAYNVTIERVAERHDAAIIDLAAAVRALPDASGYFWDTMHMSLRGQAWLASVVDAELRRRGLLRSPADRGVQ